MLPHEHFAIKDFDLLVVEKSPGSYRLYVSKDGRKYCHYDTGAFRNLGEAAEAAKRGFDPKPFLVFPYAPFSREQVLEVGPHGFNTVQW